MAVTKIRNRTVILGSTELSIAGRRGRFVIAYLRPREGQETELCLYGGPRGREQFVSVYPSQVKCVHRKTRRV